MRQKEKEKTDFNHAWRMMTADLQGDRMIPSTAGATCKFDQAKQTVMNMRPQTQSSRNRFASTYSQGM